MRAPESVRKRVGELGRPGAPPEEHQPLPRQGDAKELAERVGDFAVGQTGMLIEVDDGGLGVRAELAAGGAGGRTSGSFALSVAITPGGDTLGGPFHPGAIMTRRRKDPLRPFTDAERRELTRLRQSPTAPAAVVIRASVLLLVSGGASYQGAAQRDRSPEWRRRLPPGRAVRPGVACSGARRPPARRRHGWGLRRRQPATRILREAERRPTPEQDGTATWSLSTLRRVLRSVADGLPRVSTFTLWRVLHEAGYSHQQTRTWCPTGTALRKRKAGVVTVTDPDAGPKKVERGRLPAKRAVGTNGGVLRPGGPLPDRPPPRPELATGGGAGSATARVHPQRDSQASHTVPPRRRARARRGRDDVSQRGAAPLAEAGTVRDPGRFARATARGASGAPCGVGTLASKDCRSSRRCRRNRCPCGCCWCWTTWPGTGRRRSSCGCSPTGSCRSTLPWVARG